MMVLKHKHSNAIAASVLLVLGSCNFATLAASQGAFPQSMSLDGTWQILFDPDNKGREAGWHRDKTFSSMAGQRTIDVPSCWELTEKDYEGVAFYRRTFKVPANWKGKVIRLHFDAVNFRSEVWLNDKSVGSHEGGFTPFEFRVDKLIKPGEQNTLTLRVVGPILLQKKKVDGFGPMETPQWRGAITGGIWQPVRLIATDDIHVKDVFIEPKISDNTATFHMDLDHAGEKATQAQVEIAIRSVNQSDRVAARKSRTLNLKPGSNKQTWTLQIPNAKYWSPDNPHLYRADVSVTHNGSVSDRWKARFGMREFTIRDRKFYLNGKPLFLKATFFEGLYPVKLAYPDSREMAIREIQLAKDAGFNMIRPWRKPPPPMWLDLADEIGVLTVGSLAIECMDFPIESPRLQGWVENEVRQSILRDRNRTCVVQWELFNELKRPVLKQMLHPMSALARKLDPTRLILDESGGWAQGARMYLPYETQPIRFNDIHDYPGQQINDEVYQKLLLTGSKSHDEMRKMGLRGRMPGRNVVLGLMTFLSELGYGSLPDLVDNNKRFEKTGNPLAPPTVYHRRLADQQRQALKESGFDKVYPDLKKFCLDTQRIHGTANKRMIEAVRCNPNVKGYCIHALTAGDWIMGAGLLDLFRNPKGYAYEGTKAANQPRILSIRVRPRNVYAERGTKIEITGVNELNAVKGNLTVQVVASDGSVAFTKTIKTDLASGITPLFSEQLDTRPLKGTYTLKAQITANDGSPIVADSYSFDIFAAGQLTVPKKRIAVLDPSNSLKPFLRRVGIAFVEFDATTDRSLPVFVSRTEAHTPAQRKRFGQLSEFIKSGGTAVYLQGSGPRVTWGRAGKPSPLLPINARTKQAMGLWACIPRLVHDHPIFDGLPVNCMMGPIYENVWPQRTLLDTGGKTIAASIGYDWFPDYDLSKRHYYGPGNTWWGSDIAIVPLGRGRCIASQLRVVENLSKDPVADRILFNLVDWVSDAQTINRSAIFLKNWDAEGAAKFDVDGVTSLVPSSIVNQKSIAEFRQTVGEANKNDRITVGRVPLDYRIYIFEEYAKQQQVNLDEHTARTIEGEPITRRNGNIFLCSNSPFIREAMKKMVELCSAAGCDWISADLQTASHDSLKLGGCFCQHCEAGFAKFLGKPATWSYRKHLREKGFDTTKLIKKEAWRGEASDMPFYRQYRNWQHQALRECYDAIRNQRKFLTSHDFHGHSAPLGTHVDFDRVGEAINRNSNARIPLLYKLTDAAGRMNLITEGPEGDWENDPQNRLRLCQAYAYGAVWVVPHQQGMKRNGKWKRINPDVGDLYAFIRANRRLFDGYESWASIGLVYSHLGHRHGAEVSESAVETLVRHNVPFRLCVAGSSWWQPKCDLSGLAGFITTADMRYLNPSQEKRISSVKRPVAKIESIDSLWSRIDRPIDVSIGNATVNVVPRKRAPGSARADRLLHLVNMQLDTTHKDFTVTLSKQFTGPISRAELHAPNGEPIALTTRSTHRSIEIRIPILKEWGIVTLH